MATKEIYLVPWNGRFDTPAELCSRKFSAIRIHQAESVLAHLTDFGVRDGNLRVCFPCDLALSDKITVGDNQLQLMKMTYIYFNYWHEEWVISERIVYPNTPIAELNGFGFHLPMRAHD